MYNSIYINRHKLNIRQQQISTDSLGWDTQATHPRLGRNRVWLPSDAPILRSFNFRITENPDRNVATLNIYCMVLPDLQCALYYEIGKCPGEASGETG